MPLYIVSHKDPITPSQRDELATAITRIHANLFSTPSLFVNVKFEDASGAFYYVGGKATLINALHAHVRTGPSRPRSAYDALCAQLRAAWQAIFPLNDTAVTTPLDTIFVLGDIVGGDERGIPLPETGKDEEWVREHLGEFKKMAEEGDEAMGALMREVKERGLGV